MFRKSRATQLLKEKRLSEVEIKMRLGHKTHSNLLERYYAIIDEDDQGKAELRYIGAATESGDIVMPLVCTNCGALNEHDAPRCYRCKFPLTEEEIAHQQKVTASGVILQELLDAPEETFMDEYVATYGETVERLLLPIVSRMVAKALKGRES